MNDLWSSLLVLIVGSAVLPVQITVTILLLQSKVGRLPAVAWVAGMTLVRVAQGVVFGIVLGTGVAEAESTDRPGPIASSLLLVVAVMFLVSAVRKLLDEPDDDAPPPKWQATIASATAGRALLFGAAVVAASPKLWAFTLGAIAVIAEAGLGQAVAIGTFFVFIVGAESIHLALLVFAYAAPQRAGPALDRVSASLRTYNRPLMIGLGTVFGLWFLVKSLAGFGVI